MRLKALARVKGQTFNQDSVCLMQPCRKGETGYEVTDVNPKGNWGVVCHSRYLRYWVSLSPFLATLPFWEAFTLAIRWDPRPKTVAGYFHQQTRVLCD